jgi:glutaredoxin
MTLFRLHHIVLATFCLALGLAAHAQTYRWTDPASGRTMYTDTPPPRNAQNVERIGTSGTTVSEKSDLPFATRQAARKYPVVLYTGAECSNCARARDLLNRRKIPFTEKILQTKEDEAALKNLVGDAFVPSITVGQQKVRGFDAAAYDNALDLAGYPKAGSAANTR